MSAPCAASSRAMARPIPREAPVTSATSPESGSASESTMGTRLSPIRAANSYACNQHQTPLGDTTWTGTADGRVTVDLASLCQLRPEIGVAYGFRKHCLVVDVGSARAVDDAGPRLLLLGAGSHQIRCCDDHAVFRHDRRGDGGLGALGLLTGLRHRHRRLCRQSDRLPA